MQVRVLSILPYERVPEWSKGAGCNHVIRRFESSRALAAGSTEEVFTTFLPPKEVMAMVETIRRERPEMIRVTISFSRNAVRVTISIKKAASTRN